LATGGNKTRKLEFLLAQALEKKCDVVLTGGGLQSNHARQTAAAAAKLGLKCIMVLQESHFREDILYQKNGNILLDHLFGAQLHFVSKETNVEEEMSLVYKNLEDNGAKPYLIPLGGSNEIGATGYVLAAEETFKQFKESKIQATHLICAVGTGGTQAGLIIGAHLKNWHVNVLGFSVGIKNPALRVRKVLESSCTLRHFKSSHLVASYEIDENYFGVGYGQTTPESIAAIKLVAQTEGILLDPVYTGKAMAGLIDCIVKGRFKKNDVIIFFHTGGNVALHAYADEF
jgi:L-cysteate sulfo-lyase